MSAVEQIETAILQLPDKDFRRLSDWLLELVHKRWDKQLEQDVAAGRLDALADEALNDFQAGRCKKL